MNGYICQGFNPLMSIPDKNKVRRSLAKLKFLITMDPLETETARFWEDHGEFNPIDPAKVMTEVIQLPTTCFAEDEGSLSSSSRWLQWHVPAQDPPFETRSDIDILAGVFTRMRRLYKKEGGAFPDPIVNTYWPYLDEESPTPEELAKELNGYALAPVKDPVDLNKVIAPGKQLDNFGQLQADGSTLCGCWIYSGCWTEQGNVMAHRNTADPSATGIAPGWAFAWPSNRRIGEWVRVWSKRGSIKAKAVVTKRIKPLLCDGREVHVIGIPIHWGFIGSTVEGYGANALTPFVGDANTNTPEYKAFLVNVERTTAPDYKVG